MLMLIKEQIFINSIKLNIFNIWISMNFKNNGIKVKIIYIHKDFRL